MGSEMCIRDRNARLPQALPLDRFRASVLLEGCEPYAEDRMHTLEAGEVRIRIVKPCTRCVITSTDQATAERDGDEPLRTLRTYRWDPKLRGVIFAQNAIVEAGDGAELRLGMVLEPTWK